MRASLSLVSLLALACGSTSQRAPSRPLSDDAIAAFGATPTSESVEADEVAPATIIELADGERLEELRALIRFDAGPGSDPACALYALRVSAEGVAEGRASVACEAASPEADVRLAPVEDARLPRLVAALTGASLERVDADHAPSPRAIHLWLETDRRRVDGSAAPIRWPNPNAEATEAPAERSPANLSEVWEAVMYPHRYR